jgi:predicted O-methyltransferase YrrM
MAGLAPVFASNVLFARYAVVFSQDRHSIYSYCFTRVRGLDRKRNSRCLALSVHNILVKDKRDHMNSLDHDPVLRAVLERLHAESSEQEGAMRAYLAAEGTRSTVGTEKQLQDGRAFWRDKLVALEADKARFCYSLCRAMNVRRIVEAGTSFGVSTLYLAAAIRDNGGGVVIGTEYEPSKVSAARRHFSETGLSAYIDLREGDIRQTLQNIEGPVDFLLLDIWTPLARPTLDLVAPRMRTGAVVITDNTGKRRPEYGDLFSYLERAANGFTTMTLPFDGGLEMSVKVL